VARRAGAQALPDRIDWNAPDHRPAADALMRQIVLEYVAGYLEGGNERLAVYRDKSRPTFVAREFRAMTDGMPELTTYMPKMRGYLLDYPKVTLPESTSFLYWQETVFGLKPTIRISHLTIREGPDDTVVTSKMLREPLLLDEDRVAGLLPDPARGAGGSSRSTARSDGLSGFTGMFVRRRVRSGWRTGARGARRRRRLRIAVVTGAMRIRHRRSGRADRLLRAGVLGANDGVVSSPTIVGAAAGVMANRSACRSRRAVAARSRWL
jgi:hypothetical protein